MEADLVRRLRSPLADERHAAAKMLGKLGTEAAVEALIAVAQDSESSLDDQLLAIECLGDTRSPEALSYIQGLCCETAVEIPTTYTWGPEGAHEETCLDEEHVCANARGPLRFALTYIVQLYELRPDSEGIRRRPEADIAADRESIPRSRDAFRVIRAALEKLT